MDVPLEISFRGVQRLDEIDELIREKAGRLEKVCDYINSCRIAVEKPHVHQESGGEYRVRIDVTVPPGHEIVAERTSRHGDMHVELQQVIRESFSAAERQLKELVEKQRGEVKEHPAQQAAALVRKLFPEEDYGFLETADGREIYFHRNSVAGDRFDELRVGSGVNFVEEEGKEGPQATTVRIVSTSPPRE